MTRRGGGGAWGRLGGSDPDLARRPGSDRRTLARIAGFFRPYRARLAFIGLLILISVSVGVVNPILLKLIIDNLTGPQDLGLLWVQAGLMIALPILTSAVGVWQTYLSNVVGQRVMNDLRVALYATSNGCRSASSPRRAPARSRAGSATTSAGSSPS